MNWTVKLSTKLQKKTLKLPKAIQESFFLLGKDLQADGPEQRSWPNYGKLKGTKDVYHCHLNKGKPRYVVVWKVTDDDIQIMEIKYVGTHEKVNYREFS
ncbi:type II toxin-antitoxin system RelE family toxin [Maridesulfovibrio sp. FT414]|uniref:type II toxin-antitoxin system RelE family toxin n=1 Tax=Maridesulfovibrio sp. FT414 TaxID=2979469 RepID=UPI003D80395C